MAKKKDHDWGISFRHIYVLEWFNADSNQWNPESLHYEFIDAYAERVIRIKQYSTVLGNDNGESDYRIRKYIPAPKKGRKP